MKFLVDAQLPRRLCELLAAQGHDAVHTLDLAEGNRTSDKRINELSENEQRVVISKDADFIESFWVQGKPYKLLLISTGNITNNELNIIFIKNLPAIVSTLTEYDFVELTRTALIGHG